MRFSNLSITHMLYFTEHGTHVSTQEKSLETNLLLKNEKELKEWATSLDNKAPLWLIFEKAYCHVQSLRAPNLEGKPLQKWINHHLYKDQNIALKKYFWHLLKTKESPIDIQALFWGLEKKQLSNKLKLLSKCFIKGILPDILLYNNIAKKALPSDCSFIYLHLSEGHLHLFLNDASGLHYRKVLINKLCLSDETHLQSFITKTFKQTCVYYKHCPSLVIHNTQSLINSPLDVSYVKSCCISLKTWLGLMNSAPNETTVSLLLRHSHGHIIALEKTLIFCEKQGFFSSTTLHTHLTYSIAATIVILLIGISFTYYSNVKTKNLIDHYKQCIKAISELDQAITSNSEVINQLNEWILSYNHTQENKQMWIQWFEQLQNAIQSTTYTWLESLEFKDTNDFSHIILKGKMLLKDAHSHTLLSKEAIDFNIHRLTQNIQAIPYIKLAQSSLIKKETPYILQFEFVCVPENMPLKQAN